MSKKQGRVRLDVLEEKPTKRQEISQSRFYQSLINSSLNQSAWKTRNQPGFIHSPAWRNQHSPARKQKKNQLGTICYSINPAWRNETCLEVTIIHQLELIMLANRKCKLVSKSHLLGINQSRNRLGFNNACCSTNISSDIPLSVGDIPDRDLCINDSICQSGREGTKTLITQGGEHPSSETGRRTIKEHLTKGGCWSLDCLMFQQRTSLHKVTQCTNRIVPIASLRLMFMLA